MEYQFFAVAIVNAAGRVINTSSMVDQAALPPIPLEIEKPRLPSRPAMAQEPQVPTIGPEVEDGFAAAIVKEYARQLAAWEQECADKQAKYENDIAEYNAEAEDFNNRYREATMYRVQPLEGHEYIRIPEGVLVTPGVTTFVDGQFVTPE